MTGKKNNTRLAAVLMVFALSLSACTSVKKELGVERNSPDEFMVVKRAPLTLPPDYTLRPPTDQGETRPVAASASAKEAVLGKSQGTASKTTADTKLLDKIGASMASPDIRKQIDEDNGYISLKNRSVADKLIFWNNEAAGGEVPASVVDAKAEAERIRKNQAAGKPLTDGTVPVIEKKSGTLDRIF